jgi:iron transport multicopper oxidase
MMLSTTFLSLVSSLGLALAATVTYDFEIGWVKSNPDGAFERDTVGINGKWPVPTIEVKKGDRLIVNAVNKLGDRLTSIHFHGLYHNGTSHMDGPSQVTQCGIAPGASFTYNFTVSTFHWAFLHT